ncbi:protein AAR2 homolog isoform X2 [Ixodes scapularis]
MAHKMSADMLEESEGGVPEVDAEVLASLQARGATFVFLDVPAGTEFGMNMSTHTVGDNFRGVKLIPAGVHFIHYSAVGRSGNSAPRTGFFHHFAQGELLVKRWDKAAEDISSAPISAEEEERIRANLTGDLDRYLGVFSYSEWSRWISLSKHITREVVARLQPESKLICSATPFESQPFCSHRGRRNSEGHADSAAMDTEDKEADIAAKADKLVELKELPEFMIRYTPFPKRRHPSNATPAEITRHGMDSSYVLESLLSAWPHERDLLGELQFVFVCFLVGHVYPSFEQWQRLVSAFCTSAEAVNRHPDLYSELLSVLHFQLREVPTDFFVDIVARKNFVTDALSALFRNVADSDVPDVGPASLKKKAFRFKTSLVELMGWSFDEEEPDEERPVVVELDDVD